MSFRDLLNRVQYGIRESSWGGAKLRPGLPRVDASPGRPELGFYRLLLDTAFGPDPDPSVLQVWDIGCRNWSYARALAEKFPRAELIGVEADGRRRYWNLHRRMDMASAFAAELAREGHRTRCVFSDFRATDLSGAVSGAIFLFFYPFVSENPCLSWGLPLRFADFRSLLTHVREAAPSPRLLSCHQGEWEGELAREAWAGSGFRISSETVIEPERFEGLWPSPHPVVLLQQA